MANPENLKNGAPYQFKSGDQAARAGSKGGKASGAAKRRKKSMAETINYLMSLPVSLSQSKIREAMTRFGIPEDEQTQRTAAAFNMILEVSKGNVAAFRALNDAETREVDQKLKKSQFAYQKKHDKEIAESAETASNLADIIEKAYRARDPDPDTDADEDAADSSSGASEEEDSADDEE